MKELIKNHIKFVKILEDSLGGVWGEEYEKTELLINSIKERYEHLLLINNLSIEDFIEGDL